MRIGIDVRIAHYARGGIRNYGLRLLRALARIDAESEYIVLHSRKSRHPPVPGPNFYPVACWTPAHHRMERWTLGAEVARLRLDLLHSIDFIPPAWGYRRSVITVHDLTFLHYPQFITVESRAYYNRQIADAVRRAEHILADSHATQSDLASMLNVPADKVTVVHLAADPVFRPLDQGRVSSVVARHGLGPGFLLCVGTLEPRKNLPGLLEAYRLLLDGLDGINGMDNLAPLVLIGGRGWLYDDIFERVETLRLSDRVQLLHDVPDADLPALYNAASLLTTPSFYEGFGLPALEAMACGTPVVVSDRSSLPEIVGQAGLLVNPDDPSDIAQALARVLTDHRLRERMRELGLAQAAQFSWDQTARETLAVYRRVLEVG